MSNMQLVVETHMEPTRAREHVYGLCASSLSGRRVPFDSVYIRTTGWREHPSGRIVAILPVSSHFWFRMLVRHRTTSVRQRGSLDRASRSAERQRSIKRTRTRTSDMSRNGRRLQQVGDRHDGHSDIDEQRRVRHHQRLVRERVGTTRGSIDAMGRARGDYESSQGQEKST